MQMRIAAAVALSQLVLPAFGISDASAQSLEQIEKSARAESHDAEMERIGAESAALLVKLKALQKEEETLCIKAFGHRGFCECVVGNTPMTLTFFDYISATIATEEQIRTNAPEDKRTALLKARKVRDKCVADAFGGVDAGAAEHAGAERLKAKKPAPTKDATAFWCSHDQEWSLCTTNKERCGRHHGTCTSHAAAFCFTAPFIGGGTQTICTVKKQECFEWRKDRMLADRKAKFTPCRRVKPEEYVD